MAIPVVRADQGLRVVQVDLRAEHGEVQNGDPANVRWMLQPALQAPPGGYYRLAVVSTDIPNTHFTVDESTNVIRTQTGAAPAVNGALKPGMYDIFSLASALEALPAFVAAGVTVDASSVTGKLTVSVGAGGPFSLLMATAPSTLGPIIGLEADHTLLANTDYELPSTVNLAYHGTMVYLRSGTLHGSTLTSSAAGACLPSDIIAKVPMANIPQWGFAQVDLSHQAVAVAERTIDTLQFSLTQRDGRAWNLRGINDWGLRLSFTVVEDDYTPKRVRNG